ncbi:MAG: MarR family transcriptional regulator [Actinobacteria bacterium]|nr:MarR family transcriptional regulator [Actinomycetota bacterium]
MKSTPLDPTPLNQEPFGPPLIGALLRIPWEAVRRHMLERLHERGFDDLDAAHLNVIRFPGPQGARPTDLAAQLGISKQALNHLLGGLERLGYLEREPDPDDRRSKRIVVTQRGIAAAAVIREAVGEMEAAWAQQLGPSRFANLRELLLELQQPPGPGDDPPRTSGGRQGGGSPSSTP